MNHLIDKLLLNSKFSQLAFIEIHNKPLFPFRYEVCTILNINSWELLLKAFILKYHSDVRIINNDWTTKPFDECLKFTNSILGKDFLISYENIGKIYEYRCNIIHFYQDNITSLLLPLLSKNILLYHDFLFKYFNINIAEEIDLILLPIGFNRPVSPMDFLSNKSELSKSSEAVQTFVKSIIKSTELVSKEGFEESILLSFKMGLVNESRYKNADFIASITNDEDKVTIKVDNVIGKFTLTENENEEGVKKVKIEEETLYDNLYTETHHEVINKCKILFSDFKQSIDFVRIMKSLRGNPTFHKQRFLDIHRQSGSSKNYYTTKVYDELAKHFTIKE
ncbi:MAG: hypothetical protein J0M18_05080 [Ignavibacteria bacterium]|nr:hypothetical protein [Ignavibacteria bacterium]